MMKSFFLFHFMLVACFFAPAQTLWSLQQCVDFAIEHNVSMKEAHIQQRMSKLLVSEQKASLWPSFTFTSNSGYRFGLSENPTTGTLQSNSFWGNGFSLSAGVTLFSWFANRHTLKALQTDAQAGELALEKMGNDIVLNVQVAYLQALLAKELYALTALQAKQTKLQTEAVKRKVIAGVLSETDLSQFNLQLLRDSVTLLSSLEQSQKSILQLKAVVALDPAVSVDVTTLGMMPTNAESMRNFDPEALFAQSLKSLPEAKQLAIELEGSDQRIRAAKARRLPVVSLYASMGTNYVNIPSAQSFAFQPAQPTGAKVQIGSTNYDVMAPTYQATSYGVTPFFRQLHKNFGQNIGINVSVPLLNGRVFSTNIKKEEQKAALLKLRQQSLTVSVKSNIYLLYNEVVATHKKLKLMEHIVKEAATVFEGEQKKYDLMLLSTQDLLISRNTLERAKSDLLAAKYEFVFALKHLEFYLNL